MPFLSERQGKFWQVHQQLFFCRKNETISNLSLFFHIHIIYPNIPGFNFFFQEAWKLNIPICFPKKKGAFPSISLILMGIIITKYSREDVLAIYLPWIKYNSVKEHKSIEQVSLETKRVLEEQTQRFIDLLCQKFWMFSFSFILSLLCLRHLLPCEVMKKHIHFLAHTDAFLIDLKATSTY